MAMATLSQNKSKLKEIYGLEVPNHLTYQGWEPGGTYTKSLILKNVKLKTQKIKFRIASKNFFCELYPHPVMLSAGNSCTLPVTFRPKHKSEITENVEISTPDGHFTVPLVAVIPKPRLLLPTSIQLGLCEVKNEINVSFDVTNAGSVSTPFRWECNSPFHINPTSGTFSPKESIKLNATFKPPMASLYKCTAACHYGDQYSKSVTVTLEGTGKFPHLLVKESSSVSCNGDNLELLFGQVSLCTSVEKSIDLINVSPVPASFTITPETDSHTQDSMFRFTNTHGTVLPQGNLTIKIICSPSFTHQCFVNHFSLGVKGGLSKILITCKAQPTSPKVVFDKECISYGSIACCTSSIACLNLINHSKTSSVYQFQIDPNSVFILDNPSGNIEGGATVSLRVIFNPSKPLPYHRAITCIILNQEPLVVHFIGSAYSEIVKPALILHQHVLLYESIAPKGLSKLPPQYLLECIDNGSLTVTDNGLLVPDKIFHPPLDKLAPPTANSNLTLNYFKHGSDKYNSHHFVLENDNMQFGYISPHRSSEGKIVTITNLTQGTVICSWITGHNDIFQVVPNERELPPQSTVAFAVSFWPKEPNNLFCKELECFVFYKALCDRTLIDSRVLLPPWCLTITVTGHTFSSGVEPFQANVVFNNNNLILPNTLPNKPSYRSFVIQSNCDTPTLYSFESNNNNHEFSLKPKYGIIPGRYCQIVTTQFLPTKAQQYDQPIKCIFNNYPKFTKLLQLVGVSESPRLILDKKESLFFKPTCVGGSSGTQITITNPCGQPLRFAWLIKGPVSKCLKISPRAGILEPNQRLVISFTFTPLEVKRYHFATVVSSLMLNDDNDGDCQKYRVPLCIYGEGTTGTVKCLNPVIDCGYVTIGTSSKVALTLRNTSSCTLKIRLGASQIIETISDQQREQVSPGHPLHGLEFAFTECEIEPFTTMSVPIVLRPSKTAKYMSNIFYQYALINEDGVSHDLCSITVYGAYPNLSIVDVQGDGTANSLSKSQIWSMLQLTSINRHLCEDPSPAELRYTISTRHSITRRAPILTRAIQDFNFCPGPLSDETHSTYHLILTNPGQVETEWAFKFPMDMYMEPEFWAETGRLDPIEQHELDVVKNSLFSIEPKQGKLRPGEKIMLKLSYVHSHLGTKKLPVLLKVDRGREIMLNFTGVTSSPDTPCIIFTSTTHTFTPMSINTITYPIQVLEIYNASDVVGSYTIDTSPLDELRESNYDNNILECLCSCGNLPPKQTTKIQFIFSPLEAKVYTVDLTFHFSDGSTQIVTLIAEGVQSDHSSVTRNDNINNTIPITSTLTLPWQLVQLSQDKLVLGDTPLFAVIQRIVFMRNTSDSTISYRWDLENNEIVSIQPSSGYIQPGKSAQLRVKFHSELYPALYNMDLMCFVTNECQMKVYQKKLKQCETLVTKKSDEFIITDKKSFTKQINSKEETYEEWKKIDMSKKSKSRTRKRNSEPTIVPPIIPEPCIIHLSIMTNTYSIPDYCRLYGSIFDTFSIDYNSIMTKTRPMEKHTTVNGESKVNVSDSEMTIIVNTLAECLRDLEKDSNFLSSLQSIANASIPYFTQFKSDPLSSNEDTLIKASRHRYADGLQHNLSLVECGNDKEGSMSGGTEGSEYRNNIDEGSGISIGLPKPLPPITIMEESDVVGTKIKRMTEFQSLTEVVLENVLLNIIKEVNKGEVSLTAPVYTIAKPPPL